MAAMFDDVVDYVQSNPALVAGVVLAFVIVAVTQGVVSAALGARSGVLKTDYQPYTLERRTRVSHNTILLRFALPFPDSTLGLPLGRHLSVQATLDGRPARRPYTPTSSPNAAGHFELLVKVYPSPHGLMSRHLESLSIGDTLDVRGPLGKFSYKAGNHTRINMVCGGTGITPMWQVFRAILSNPADDTPISLVFANVTEDDILLREEIESLAETHPQFDVYFVLNDPPEGWGMGVGFVTKDILLERFGEAEAGSIALMCGPPPMNKAMKGIVAELGYKDGQVFKF